MPVMWTSCDVSPCDFVQHVRSNTRDIFKYVCKSICVCVCPCNLACSPHQLVNCLCVWPASNDSDSIEDKRELQWETAADWWKHWQPPPKMGALANPTPRSQSLVFPPNLHAGQNTCLLLPTRLRPEDLRVSELWTRQTFTSPTD